MGADLAVPDQQTDLSPAEQRQNLALWKLANRYAKSQLVPKELQDDPDSIMYLLSYGQSLGLPPAMSLPPFLWIIQGRVDPSAQVRAGVAMARGHEVLVKVTSSELCTITLRRHGSDVWQEVTYTIDDAKKAGALDTWVELWKETQSGKRYKAATHYVSCLCGRHEAKQTPDWVRDEINKGKIKSKEPWHTHPDDMLWAATIRRATKRFTPDAFLNIALPDDPPAADFAVHPGDLPEAEVHQDHGAVEGPEPDDGIADAEIVEPEPAPDERNRASEPEPAPEAQAATEAGTAPAPAQSPPEPFPDTEPKAGPAFSRGFAIACTEAGIEDDGRHALIAYVTGGRTCTSKEVRRGAEAAACFAALERVKAETLAFTTDDAGELVVEDKEAQG